MRTIGSCLLFCGLAAGCGGAVVTTVDTGEPGDEPPPPLEVELRANRIVFNHRIRFEHDSDRILTESHVVLDRVAELMAAHPNLIRLQVQGHSSTDGATRHNQELSAQRAAAVAEYLRGAGVAAEVTSQGYGETYPLCHDDTVECHERNRRVEFFVDER